MRDHRHVLTETVEITVGGGTTMGIYAARPPGLGPLPGGIVGMELFGISAHIRDVCERIAVTVTW